MTQSGGTQPTSRRAWPNPFYVALVLTSTAFVVTALAYLMGPFVVQKAERNPGQGAGALAVTDWLEQRGPWLLGVEFLVMLGCGILAMVIDPWLVSRAKRRGP